MLQQRLSHNVWRLCILTYDACMVCTSQHLSISFCRHLPLSQAIVLEKHTIVESPAVHARQHLCIRYRLHK
jgi:hypothetical protein